MPKIGDRCLFTCAHYRELVSVVQIKPHTQNDLQYDYGLSRSGPMGSAILLAYAHELVPMWHEAEEWECSK